MLGLIIDLKNHLEMVVGLVGLLAVIWRFALRPVWHKVQRIDEAIGSNGGSSLFEQIEHVKDMLHIHGSLADGIDRPILFVSASGEVEAVNIAVSEQIGWSLDRLKLGGWRQLFDRIDQEDWDETIARQSVFTRTVNMGGHRCYVSAKPVFNKTKFLGWRVVLTPQRQEIRE